MYDVKIENMCFAYPKTDRLILDHINIEVNEGDFVCILGQSGCGKSTLLRLLAGLEKPTKGQLSVGGLPIEGAGLDRGVVFQDYGLFPWMSAGENILLAMKQKYPSKSKKELREIAMKAVRDVGLDETVFGKFPKELSGGMKQRCAIARAFSIDSPLLLMDEPFGALDAVTRARLQDMLLNLWTKEEQRKTVFFVTHDVDEAILLGTRIIVLGQSPSKVICQEVISDDKKPNRKNLYENKNVLDLRNRLIKHINEDVAERC